METVVHILRGLLGISAFLGICYLFSSNRKAIDWRLVGFGILAQLVIALLVLKVHFVNVFFQYMGKAIGKMLEFSKDGANFIFGNVLMGAESNIFVGDHTSMGFIFAFQVLPTIIFFSAVTSALYYVGALQLVVKGFAWVMTRTLRISGAESLSNAANIFLGQTEAPLMIKPYLPKMTKSELLSIMVGGMANIAGSVFGAYMAFLGGADPAQQEYWATHLLTVSIMSAPAGIVAAKILLPESNREQINTDLTIPKDKIGSNFLDAISNGTTDGVKLAVNVGAMLIVFTAMVSLVNYVLLKSGSIGGLNEAIYASSNHFYPGLTFQYILSFIGAPVAWLMGIDGPDTFLVGQLLGIKTTINEFVAFSELDKMKTVLQPRSLLIATYALCGFANFASIGIQIGGIGSLAPNQRPHLASLGLKALLGGSIATFLCACVVGMFS